MSTPEFQLTVDSKALTLIEFDGVEAMNRLFEFVFTCEDLDDGTKLVDLIDADAVFTIKEYDSALYSGDLDIPGYISKVSKISGNWVLEFHPKIKKATTNSRSEIYFKDDASLTAKSVIDYEFNKDIVIEDRNYVDSIVATLPSRKLFCQYNESNFNFVARLCDYWGFQFYFDHYAQNIVISDNDQFDKEFSSKLKTKKRTPDNHKLKIRNWFEEITAPSNFITVIGHDYANAGTDIISTYPAGDNVGLTESRLTISGVQSQDEADYLAQIRYESKNCLNHKASGTVGVPYLNPGFIVETDDSDFSEAVVIKSVHKARNLNAVNQAQSPSYECDIEMIPATSHFRPDAFYPVPQATTVIGKTISDSVDSNLAQRNEQGEYKVKFMGFENESDISSDPWVRKAQTTGGSNSVDIPLTPNTEVILAFVDNNPNCPYIQHAMDNSLHPVPVTNVNAHHAVISTDGMLVTSSLQGRYNVATTRKEERVADSDISSTVKNYFTNRGDFNQNTNFIDPSGSNSEFTPEDRASGNFIISQQYGDQVQISQGDRLHWHNGNLYDFGGYWNYNLGNSYEENFIDQTAPLNIKVAKDSRSGDILTSNGPSWGSVDFASLKDGKLSDSDVKPASHGSTDIATDSSTKTFKVNTGGDWSADGMNVAKSYNASYDYKFGDSIDISDRVNSLEVKHTDSSTEAVDMVFHNGVLRQWEKAVGRVVNEKKWASNGKLIYEGFSETNSNFVKTVKEKTWDVKGDQKISDSTTTEKEDSIKTDVKTYNFNTGALATHNIKKTDGMGTAEMDFSYSESAISKFNFGGTKSFSLSAQGDASIAISFSGSMSLSVGFGLSMDIKTGVEIGMDLDLRTGSTLGLDSKGKFEWSGIGFKARAESRAQAESKMVELVQTMTTIEDYGLKIDKENMKFTSGGLDITSSFVKLYT